MTKDRAVPGWKLLAYIHEALTASVPFGLAIIGAEFAPRAR